MWGVCDRSIRGDRRRCMWLTTYIASHVFLFGSSLFLIWDFFVGFGVLLNVECA